MSEHPLITLCKKHGNQATDLRDAAHEIFHARRAGGKNWDREVIHKRLTRVLMRQGRALLWLHEMEARAVEQIVCKHFGVETKGLDHWVGISCMEAIKFRLPHAEFEQSLEFATKYMAKDYVRREAQCIIELGE